MVYLHITSFPFFICVVVLLIKSISLICSLLESMGITLLSSVITAYFSVRAFTTYTMSPSEG